jgi:hypothetical protein
MLQSEPPPPGYPAVGQGPPTQPGQPAAGQDGERGLFSRILGSSGGYDSYQQVEQGPEWYFRFSRILCATLSSNISILLIQYPSMSEGSAKECCWLSSGSGQSKIF